MDTIPRHGIHPSWSSVYSDTPHIICFMFDWHAVRLDMSLALFSAGSNNVVNTPIIAITTSNSTSVKILNVFLISPPAPRFIVHHMPIMYKYTRNPEKSSPLPLKLE